MQTIMRRSRFRITDDDKIGYLLVLPFTIFFVVFVLSPIVLNIYYSFTNYDLRSSQFVGFKNYINLFSDKVFLISLKNTCIYTFTTLFFTMALGLIISVLLNNKVYFIHYFRIVYFLPYITSMVSISMVWLWMYEPSNGIFNVILKVLGFPAQQWLFNKSLAMGCVIFMSIWKLIGYNMIIYMAGLQNINGELYEASMIDGANALQQFGYITFPLLKPITFFLMTTGFINNFNVFEQVNILTNGGPVNSTTTVVHQVYQRAFSEYLMGYSSAITVVIMVIVLIVTGLNYRYNR